MFAEERHTRIAELVAAKGRVSVAELADRFDITKETVRRDLAVLENERILRRVHGGAVGTDKASTSEQPLSSRQSQHHEEKSRIAAKALEMIPSAAGSIVLDAGTTTEQLAELLVERPPASDGDGLLVITHAVPIASLIANSPALQLELLGGRVRGLTRAGVGPHTIRQLGDLRPDIAFVGTNGVHADFGLSTPDSLEASVKAAIVHSARRVVVLADSSKLDEETLVRFATLKDVDTLITDAPPAGELAGALADADVEVVIA
jgi:DeoR family transcriptional regulator, fructose operon transcriptional repressor